MNKVIEISSYHLKKHDRRQKLKEYLLRKQKKKCYYCEKGLSLDPFGEKAILEHFVPRHMRKEGEKHVLVLACQWCDKTKGMLTGFEYMEIVNRHKRNNNEMQMRQLVKAECKALYIKRHNKYLSDLE